MDDVWGDFLGPPHGTTPVAVVFKFNSQEIGKKKSFHLQTKNSKQRRGDLGFYMLLYELGHTKPVRTFWQRKTLLKWLQLQETAKDLN